MKFILSGLSFPSQVYQEWQKDKASQMSAALAFYGIFALAPVLFILLRFLGLLLVNQNVEEGVFEFIESTFGPAVANTLLSITNNIRYLENDSLVLAITLLSVLWGATGLFRFLTDSLQQILVSRQPEKRTLLQNIALFIKDRFLALAAIIAFGIVLALSLLVSTFLPLFYNAFSDFVALPQWLIELSNFIITLLFGTLFFTLIYKFLSGTGINWRYILTGSFLTALLFTFGKTLIGMYIGNRGFQSLFGAASSVVILILWMYYLAQIFFLGAEVIKVLARKKNHNPVL